MIENQQPTIRTTEERAVLVGVIKGKEDQQFIKEYLDELAFLAKTSGAVTEKRFTQKLDAPDPSTYIRKGKINEIREYVKEHKIDTVIFDDDLSPSQIRNVENSMKKIKVLDRSDLILDIFAKRARTAHAKTQVELAQYQNLLPRLTRMWTHLSRQKGGIGTKGPGEREIETDRRIIQDKITQLKKKLAKIDKQKATQRKNRGKLVRVALIGYTNVGKSTLMNLLSNSEVFAEDKLFATLDTTVRKVVQYNVPYLLTDTVGFIRKLPHQLVESFKSTLDEVRESDILLHVVDISHPNFEDHYKVVNETLQDIDSRDKPQMVIFNKIDQYPDIQKQEEGVDLEGEAEKLPLEELKKTWMAQMAEGDCIFISAATKENIDELKDALYEKVKAIHASRYPYHDFLY